MQLGFALELRGVTGGGETIGLPGDARQPNFRFYRRRQDLPVRAYRDQLDRQRIPFLEDPVEPAEPEIIIRTVLHERARLGNGLLAEISHFAKQLGRPRLRRLRVDRHLDGDLRVPVCVDVRVALGVELRDPIERFI